MIEPVPRHEKSLKHIIFEKIPGILFVSILLFILFGAAIAPELTAYVIIFLNVYFLYKSGMLALTLGMSLWKIRDAENKDWQLKLEGLSNPEKARETLKEEIQILEQLDYENITPEKLLELGLVSKEINRLPKFIRKIVFNRQKSKTLNYLRKQLESTGKAQVKMDWKELQHVIIIPHVKEPEHILRETLDHIKAQTFPLDQINVVLAAEGRDEEGIELSNQLAEEYGEIFNNVWVSVHELSPEETIGKSSNMKAGGMQAYAKVQEMGWDLKKTVITSCDADSKLPEQYFSYVSYEYVTRDLAEYKYYTAAMVFYNNIWRLPFYARVKNSMNTMFNTSRLVRTDKLIPFSTYSVSLWMIKEIGFWTPWVTPEDFHLFFKGQFKFGAKVSAVPIYLRIMSDAAEGQGHVDTIKNNYQQERRWSWGISDDGWILQNVFHAKNENLDFVTVYRALHSVFDHVMGPIIGILLIIGGNIPPLINPAFNETVLGAALPQVSSSIITMSTVFMIIVILLDLRFKPSRGGRKNLVKYLSQILEWITLPIASLILAVLPGLEANTRLLFGKHLEYYVTKKH